jgi:hypothetical protein
MQRVACKETELGPFRFFLSSIEEPTTNLEKHSSVRPGGKAFVGGSGALFDTTGTFSRSSRCMARKSAENVNSALDQVQDGKVSVFLPSPSFSKKHFHARVDRASSRAGPEAFVSTHAAGRVLPEALRASKAVGARPRTPARRRSAASFVCPPPDAASNQRSPASLSGWRAASDGGRRAPPPRRSRPRWS